MQQTRRRPRRHRCGTIEQGCGSPTVYAQLAAEILEHPVRPRGVRVRRYAAAVCTARRRIADFRQRRLGGRRRGHAAARASRAQRRTRSAGRHYVLKSRREPERGRAVSRCRLRRADSSRSRSIPDLGEVRVVRYVGAFDSGRILNSKTANSQFVGGVVWGISMALFEKTRYDMRTGRIMNADLAEYLVPTNADIPNPEIVMIEEDDPNSESGARQGHRRSLDHRRRGRDRQRRLPCNRRARARAADHSRQASDVRPEERAPSDGTAYTSVEGLAQCAFCCGRFLRC